MKTHNRITKYIEPEAAKVECKITDSFTNGTISGYASIFGVRDQDGDIVVNGAFKRAIDNQIAQGSVPLMVVHFAHGGDTMESVGAIIEAREDDIGLKFVAALDGSTASQELRQKVMSNPGIFGFSIGFLNNGEGFRVLPEGGRELQEINLKEITVTLMPSNVQTLGTAQGKSSIEEIVLKLVERMDALESKANECSDVPEDAEESAPSAVSNDHIIAAQKRIIALLET